MRKLIPLILLAALFSGPEQTLSDPPGKRPRGFHVSSHPFDLYTPSLSRKESAILGWEALDAIKTGRHVFSCQTGRSPVIRVLPPGMPLPAGRIQRYEIIIAHSESLPRLRYELRYRIYDLYLREYLLLTRKRESDHVLPGSAARELLARAAATHTPVSRSILRELLYLHEEDLKGEDSPGLLVRLRLLADGESPPAGYEKPVNQSLNAREPFPENRDVRLSPDGKRIAWREKGRWRRTPPLPLESIHSPRRGPRGRLWFLARRGQEKGLYLYEPGSGRLKFLAPDIIHFLPGKDEIILWSGPASGAHVLTVMRGEKREDLLETSSYPLGLARLPGGRLLFLLAGTDGTKLYGLDRKKGDLLVYGNMPPASLSLGMRGNTPVIWSGRQGRWVTLREDDLAPERADSLPALDWRPLSEQIPTPARRDAPPGFLPRKAELNLYAGYNRRFLATGSCTLGTPGSRHTLQAGGGGGLFTGQVPGGSMFLRYEGGGRRHRGGVLLRSGNVPADSGLLDLPVNRMLALGDIWQMEAKLYWRWRPLSPLSFRLGVNSRWYVPPGDSGLSGNEKEIGSQVLFSELGFRPRSGVMEGSYLSITGSGSLPLSEDLAAWFALQGKTGWRIEPFRGYFVHPSLGGGALFGKSRAHYRIPDATLPEHMAVERVDLSLVTGYEWLLKDRYTSWFARSHLTLTAALKMRASWLHEVPGEDDHWMIETGGRLSFRVTPLFQLSLDCGWLFDTRGAGSPLIRVTMYAAL